MVTVAAQVAAYAYPDEENPEDAFSWWLSPCGGTDLVPDEIKKVFDTLSSVADGVSSFKQPKFKRGSGKKGDDANPTDRAKPKAGTGGGANGKGQGSGNGVTKRRKCRIPRGKEQYVLGQVKNTVREQFCDTNQQTQKTDYIIGSINYGQATYGVEKTCSQKWAQPCYHYSSVIDAHPQWKTLTCPPKAGTTSASHKRPAVATWYKEHNKDWRDRTNDLVAPIDENGCQADEYPPAAVLDENSPTYQNGGKTDQGQMIRYVPAGENTGAGSMFRGLCMAPVQGLTGPQMKRKVEGAPPSKRTRGVNNKRVVQVTAQVDVDSTPEFTISRFEHSPGQAPPPDYGLRDNPCWPQALAARDPGFALLKVDPWYAGRTPDYDYRSNYTKGTNGS
ncbi:chitinase 18-9 [Apiospora rasikravindrae]|uniref:Chitinase 18-9 n=1 Tax=Apiospora rasikravindrae TaxID=990691 RepID=A0ABR1TYR5_9PEZI